MNTSQREFLSQSEIGRFLNLPGSQLQTAVRTGKLIPDFLIGKVKAFRRSRLPEIARTFGIETV